MALALLGLCLCGIKAEPTAAASAVYRGTVQFTTTVTLASSALDNTEIMVDVSIVAFDQDGNSTYFASGAQNVKAKGNAASVTIPVPYVWTVPDKPRIFAVSVTASGGSTTQFTTSNTWEIPTPATGKTTDVKLALRL